MKLSQNERDKAYRLFYGEGMTLHMVMTELGCSLYDLSPWLTAPAGRIAAEAISSERERRRALDQVKGEGGGDG